MGPWGRKSGLGLRSEDAYAINEPERRGKEGDLNASELQRYLLGGLLPRPPPDGLPVVLGPLEGRPLPPPPPLPPEPPPRPPPPPLLFPPPPLFVMVSSASLTGWVPFGPARRRRTAGEVLEHLGRGQSNGRCHDGHGGGSIGSGAPHRGARGGGGSAGSANARRSLGIDSDRGVIPVSAGLWLAPKFQGLPVMRLSSCAVPRSAAPLEVPHPGGTGAPSPRSRDPA